MLIGRSNQIKVLKHILPSSLTVSHTDTTMKICCSAFAVLVLLAVMFQLNEGTFFYQFFVSVITRPIIVNFFSDLKRRCTPFMY